MAEHRTVDAVVAGSSPVAHPPIGRKADFVFRKKTGA